MLKKLLTLKLSMLFLLPLLCFSGMENAKMPGVEDEFLLRAIEFHGHLGPYLVLGLKAGLYANETLGKDPMKMEAFIETKVTPPESCFADGIQFSTGCTFGKGNIHLKEAPGLKVIFKKNNHQLILKLRKEIITEISSLPSEEEAWDNLAKDLYKREALSIFEIVK